MNDEEILSRGGTEEDIKDYAEANGANLTKEDFMTCCEKCIGVSPIRGVVCNNKLCPCHSKDDGLERVLSEFEKYFAGDRDCTHVANCKCKSATVNAIKSFFTQVYQEAYAKGEKEGQARMDNSGRLLFQQGVESERERIRKEIEKMLRFGPNNNALSRDDVFTYLESWRYCLNQVKKII